MSQYSSFIWLTKGLDKKTNKFFDELLIETFGNSIDCCLISGASFAKDLVCGEKICVSVASNNSGYLDTIEKCFITNKFIMQKTNDLIGVQISGVMKNIAAILSGILTTNNYNSSDILKMIEITKKEILIAVDHEGGRVQRLMNGFTHLPSFKKISEIEYQFKSKTLQFT